MNKKVSSDYEALLKHVTQSKNMDLPLTITQKEAEAILHVVHDVGGEPDGPLDKSEHKTAFWEKSTHCVAECLAWRGHWCSEERRRRENDLGETIYFATPYYARWLLAIAKMLIEKGLITPDELIQKMDVIRRREGYIK
ncbi:MULTISPECIES: SH3-like domain-containing protein [unclassified Legionella]|uniref:SH3-like domain-containing protein n=1 Tax=Legionella sp. PC997 TaxID=2755562 RepID=UPI0015FC2558|nr:SH3-like domain-containing protein [Legionella sp. PC997]QMT60782.1 Thiocyanate hydrolase subunit beta [Legionella sp. PC997]